MSDFRNNRGKRHPLSAILAFAIIAMMTGCRSYAASVAYGRTSDENITKALGFRHTKTPCASTFHYVFKAIDVSTLENALIHWTIGILEHLIPETQRNAIAIGGKTLCESHKQGATFTHLLSVVSHQLGITLKQQPVAAKTNEIPIAREILQALDVSQKIVPTDAPLTQKAFCQTVSKKNVDYVLPVKANQKQTYEDIRCLFETETSQH